MAVQLTGINGLSRLLLARWMAMASSSFPVPLSPRINTVASVSATSLARERSSSMAALLAIMSLRQSPSVSTEPAPEDSRNAFSVSRISSFPSIGLVRKEKTPCLVASTASGIEPCAVIIITGTALFFSRMASNNAMPSIPGMRRSVRTTWGLTSENLARASSPLKAVSTW